MTISMDKKYTTRDGRNVTLDAVGKDFAVGVIDGNRGPSVWWSRNGKPQSHYLTPDDYQMNTDLIPAPEEVTLWVNVYRAGSQYELVANGSEHQANWQASFSSVSLKKDAIARAVPITFKVPG